MLIIPYLSVHYSIIGWIRLKRMKCRDGSICWIPEKWLEMLVRKLGMKITT
jgi:hypothetical protein